jgi:flagellar biosynthetic protein FliQ
VTDAQVVHIGVQAMIAAGKLSAPLLITALVVGFVISVFQSMTQIQEPTLSFVPKLVAMGLALLFTGNWMLRELITFTTSLYSQIPDLLGGG